MTNKELWDLRLSLIKDVMTLTDKQIEYILNNLKERRKQQSRLSLNILSMRL